LSKKFGKSYSNLGLGEFRNQLKAKLAARDGGLGELVLVDNRYSTKTCSACGSLSGPSGWNGLQVRQWCCDSCGAIHDRDRNAAINTLLLGEGITSELGKFVSRRSDFGFRMNSVNQRKPS
jgi:transposase